MDMLQCKIKLYVDATNRREESASKMKTDIGVSPDYLPDIQRNTTLISTNGAHCNHKAQLAKGGECRGMASVTEPSSPIK